MHNMILCGSGVYSRGIRNMFLVGQVPGLVEHVNTWVFSDTLNVINVRVCMMVLLIELYLFSDLNHSLRSQQCETVFN